MKGTCARALPIVAIIVWMAACSGAPSRPAAGPPGIDRQPRPPGEGQELATPRADRSGEDALGGEATVEIAAPSYAIMDALCRPEAAWRVLPNVVDVEDLGEHDGDLMWRMTHKLGIFTGGYVLRLRRDWADNGRHTIRFWIDTRFARDVDDAWGYFHLEPLGPDRTRLHYRVRAVLLPGVIRWLFSRKIQWALMVVPARVRGFMEDHRAEALGSERRPLVPAPKTVSM